MNQTATAIPDHVAPNRVVDVNIYSLPGMEQDYQQSWRNLQESVPDIIWTPQNEGHWIAMRGDILAEVQSDYKRFSSRIIIIPKSIGEMHGLIPTTIDPPEHRPYRVLLNDSLAPSAIRGMHDAIQQTVIELVDSFVADGRCNFTEQFARIFPIRVFMKMVDIPEQDAPKIRLWAESMTRPEPTMSFDAAKQAFYDYLGPILEQRRAHPGDDLISRMITADMGNGPMNHDQALAISTQILIAGVDTVVNFLGFVMLYLAEHPEACAELAADPAHILPATHELFRRFGLVTIARTVREDMEFHGVQLKAGELVCIPTVVHGIDDRNFKDPMKVDFKRPRARHSGFGSGPHMCPGQELARIEIAITIEEWLKRIPHFRVAPDADTHCSGGVVGSINRLCLEWDQ